jgi:leader peptidase (prepilin peptidase) / N-methyltransferase
MAERERVLDETRKGWRRAAAIALLATLYSVLAVPALATSHVVPANILASAILGAVLVTLTVVDLESYRLPDILTLPLIAAGIGLCALLDWDAPVMRLVAAVAGYALLFFVAAVYHRLRGRHGLGLGDAKLFAAAGAWTGLEGLPSVLLVASLAALAAVGLAVATGRDISAQTRIAFGPFLALGFWAVWLYGPMTQAV